MNRKTNRVLVIATVLFAVFLGVVGWAATKLIDWVRDVPNRIVIDGDAIASSFGQAATESYHLALRDGDATIQLQVLEEQFVPLIRQNDEGAAWIRNEFGDDISALVNSDDPAVSVAASNLLSMLDAEPQTPDGG
jgi:hypothetical protein